MLNVRKRKSYNISLWRFIEGMRTEDKIEEGGGAALKGLTKTLLKKSRTIILISMIFLEKAHFQLSIEESKRKQKKWLLSRSFS